VKVPDTFESEVPILLRISKYSYVLLEPFIREERRFGGPSRVPDAESRLKLGLSRGN